MGNNNYTEYDTARVGKGHRKFNGKMYFFWYTASIKGRNFADNRYAKHVQEVKDRASTLRKQGYQVRVVEDGKGAYLFYIRGERQN